MKNILNKLKNIFTPTYNVTYAPDKSENSEVIQTYKVIGHPKSAAWKSIEGNKLFTLPVRNRDEKFRSFRVDRVISVNWAFNL